MEILALKLLVRASKRFGRYDEDYFESKSLEILKLSNFLITLGVS